jgi:hypothetical protein
MRAATSTVITSICDVCSIEPSRTPGFCEASRTADARVPQQRGAKKLTRSTPQTTIEAIMWCVRERGLPALQEAANIERLLRCGATARTEINNRIDRLIAAKRVAE